MDRSDAHSPSLPRSIMSLSGLIRASHTTHCFPGFTIVSAHCPQTTCPQTDISFSFSFFDFFAAGSPSTGAAVAGDLEVRRTERTALVNSREQEGQIGVEDWLMATDWGVDVGVTDLDVDA